MTRRVLPSQKLPELACKDPAVKGFVNQELRKHVAEVYQQFVRELVGFFTNSRTDSAATITASADAPSIRLIETDAAANETQWEIQSVAGEWRLVTLNDDGTAGATAIAVNRTGTTVDSIALTATAVTINGVSASDFARLSQSNTFTGAVQAISATGADGTFQATRSGGSTLAMSGSSSFGIFGTTTNHPLAVVTNSITRMETSAAGNFDFKSGLAVFGNRVRLFGYTVATLPAGTIGDTAYVTDALAPVFGAAVAGGGAVMVPVYYTGAAWFVG